MIIEPQGRVDTRMLATDPASPFCPAIAQATNVDDDRPDPELPKPMSIKRPKRIPRGYYLSNLSPAATAGCQQQDPNKCVADSSSGHALM